MTKAAGRKRNASGRILAIDIGVMGTARKNQPGLPPRFLDIKQPDEAFTYGGYSIEALNYCLYFIWQDNAPIIGITTAFSLGDRPENFILRPRRQSQACAMSCLPGCHGCNTIVQFYITLYTENSMR